MTNFDDIFIVIPTVRNVDFLLSWQEQFQNVRIIVCEDQEHKSIKLPKIGKKIFHYSWQEIDQELGENAWIISRKVSAIRSFGFLKAYQMGAKIIVTLDDDCYPVKGHDLVKLHCENLNLKIPSRWMNTYPDAKFMYTRGMPYGIRSEISVMLSHGLWKGVLDLDAPTHLQHLGFRAEFSEHFLQIIPPGIYYPMCSMNLAFRREITPLLYFPLMSQDQYGGHWGYHRFDDIWAGVFSKKIMDHLGMGIVNGSPFVEHRKASNVFVNLHHEAAGITTNERLWKLVDEARLTRKTAKACYLELAQKIKFPKEEYFNKLKQAMIIWANLF